MTTAIKRRRGTTTQHSTFTGLEGEITVDTTKDTLVVHDGATAGGYPLLREDLSNNTNVVKNNVSNTFSTSQIISASTSSDALRITQTGSGNALVVEDSANPDSSPFVIGSGGQLVRGYTAGFNLVNPNTGSANGPQMQTVGTTIADASVGSALFVNTAGQAAYYALAKTRGASIGDMAALQNGDNIGYLSWQGSDGTSFIRAADIYAAVDGTPGTNDMPGRLVFSTTADGASSPTERMRIGNNGGVGIGGSAFSDTSLRISRAIQGSTSSYGVFSDGQISSGVTANAACFQANSSTQAASFTLNNLYYFGTFQGTIGAGSAITNQYGFFANSALTGATNNYGFHSNIAAGTGRWNFYANGTAANYFAGETTVNSGLTIGRTAVTAPAASDGNVFSGTYTPTLTNVTNVASSTAVTCQYMRVGNVVTVSGQIQFAATTGGTAIQIGVSLPIASAFTSGRQLGGSLSYSASAFNGMISADSVNDRAAIQSTPTDTTSRTYPFTFTYQVV